jgi:hypothetical protein
MVERNRSIRLPVTDEEVRMAHELAEADGTTVTDFLRTLIRRLHVERVSGPKKPAKRKTARK